MNHRLGVGVVERIITGKIINGDKKDMIDEDGIDSALNFTEEQKRNWCKFRQEVRRQYEGHFEQCG